MAQTVMLNLFQHPIESNTSETLNQVQGDKKEVTRQSFAGRGGSEEEEKWKKNVYASPVKF
jgi:hypothetical protein